MALRRPTSSPRVHPVPAATTGPKKTSEGTAVLIDSNPVWSGPEEQSSCCKAAGQHNPAGLLDAWWLQLLLLLTAGYVLFGKDVSVMLDAKAQSLPYMNAFLIVSMVILTADWLARVINYQPLGWLILLEDASLIALIVVDISWISLSISQYTMQSLEKRERGAQQLASAVILATRSGYLTRHLHKLLSDAFSQLIALWQKMRPHECSSTATVDGLKSMRYQLSEDSIGQLVLLLLVICTVFPLLVPHEEGSQAAAVVGTLALEYSAKGSASLPEIAGTLASYFTQQQGLGLRPLALMAGGATQDIAGSYQVNMQHRLTIDAQGSDFGVLFDSSEQVRDAAGWNIWLSLTAVGLLLAAHWLQLTTVSAALLKPLLRMFNAVQAQPGNLLLAAQPSEEDKGPNELQALEEAVQRMARLVLEIGPTGKVDGHAQRLLNDGNADAATKEWLLGVMSNHQPGSGTASNRASRRFSAFDRPRRSIVGAFSRLSAARQPVYPGTHLNSQEQRTMPAAVAAEPRIAEALHMRLLISKVTTTAMDVWDFDVWAFSHEELVAHLCQMFMQQGLCQSRVASVEDVAAAAGPGALQNADVFLKALAEIERSPAFTSDRAVLELTVLWRFGREVASLMRDVPYHNFYHVMEVTHSCYCFLRLADASCCFSLWEQIALLLAAICHDLDHPGVNNAFLIATRHELAMTYNDASVLESHHLAAMFRTLSRPGLQVLGPLDGSIWRQVRKMAINAVIHTDMTFHFPLVSKVEVFQELNSKKISAASATRMASRANSATSAQSGAAVAGGAPPLLQGDSIFSSQDDRQLLLALLLHCADIGNSVKPWAIAKKWAEKVTQEFFSQGDQEAALGLPVSPLMDRNASSLPLSQINFIEFIVAPLYFKIVELLPELLEVTGTLCENLKTWYERYLCELDAAVTKSASEREADKAKATARWAAFLKKYGPQLSVQQRTSSTPRSRRGSSTDFGAAGLPGLFQRSKRKDRSRSNSGGGALGLPIATESTGGALVQKFFKKRTGSLFSNPSDTIPEADGHPADPELGALFRPLGVGARPDHELAGE